MKTVKLYESDAYISRFEAEVLSCEKDARGYKTVLSATAFFPEGGGQPCDKGFISGAEVFDVKIEADEIFHYTKTPFKKGEKVTGKIDFERRFNFMQNHTAEHIVSGIIFKKYGFDNIGFHLNDSEVTCDFSGYFTSSQLEEIELEANKKVWQNLKVRAFYPDDNENIEYRFKPGEYGKIRLVEIEDTDVCACCAPHVKSTGEIGIIKFLMTEKQHGGTRIFMKSGNFALNDYKKKTCDIKAISEMFSVKPHETLFAVQNLNSRLEEEKKNTKGLKNRLIEYEIRDFDRSKPAVLCEGFDIKELQMLADGLHKAYRGVRTALCQSDNGILFVMCGECDELQREFELLKDNFTVKGGGREKIRQGSITADEKAIKEYFRI